MRWMLSLLFLSVCYTGTGQKIYFSDTSNVWKYTNPGSSVQPSFGHVSQASYTGIIHINGMDYSILPSSASTTGQSVGVGYIREDTFLHQVFVRFDTVGSIVGKPDTLEHVLYDYNLQLGDTFRFSPNYGILQFAHVVMSVDSVLINGAVHKVWDLYSMDGWSYSYTVIEGLGCTTDVLFPVYPFYMEFTSYMYCFRNKGMNPAIIPPKTQYFYFYYDFNMQTVKQSTNDFDNINSCNYLSSVNELTHKTGLEIYPQPVSEKLTINFPQTIATGEIIMTDIFGRTVWQERISNLNTMTIQRNNIPSGLYILKVTDLQNKVIYTEKAIIE